MVDNPAYTTLGARLELRTNDTVIGLLDREVADPTGRYDTRGGSSTGDRGRDRALDSRRHLGDHLAMMR